MATATSEDVGGTTYIGESLREDLASFITMLSPEKTPFLSTIGSNKATSPRHDWETDTLDAPRLNAKPEDFSFAAGDATVDKPIRLSNYTQIYGKTISVSGSLNRSEFTTPQNYFSYQRIKRGKELMRDIEHRALGVANHAGTSGFPPSAALYVTSNPRRAGAMSAYASNIWNVNAGTLGIYNRTNASTGTTIASGAGINTRLPDGENTFAYATEAVADTTGPITRDSINGLAGLFSANNGMMSVCLVPTALKTAMSNALIAGNGGAAQRRASELAKKVNMAVDSVITEFGFDVSIIPDYLMNDNGYSDSVAFFYDPKAIKRSVLQPMDTVKDMQARYGEAYIMFCEETFEVSDPNSLGFIVGANATLATPA